MQSVLKSNISILNILSCLIVFPKQSSVLILSGPVGILAKNKSSVPLSCRKNRLDWGASLGETVYIGEAPQRSLLARGRTCQTQT